MRRALLSLSAAATVLLLSSCADPADGTDPRGTTARPTPTGTPVLPTGAPTSAAPGVPSGSEPGGSASKTPVGRQVTVDGIVEPGVEPNCRVLKAPDGEFLLVGDDVPLGVPVRITGVLTPGVSTTCQQGTPLRVVSVQRR